MKIGGEIILVAISLAIGIFIGRMTGKGESSTEGSRPTNGLNSILSKPSTTANSPPTNVSLAVSELLEIPDSTRRVDGLLGYIKSLDSGQIEEALNALMDRIGREDDSPEQMTIFKALLSRYAETSPKKAIAYVKSLMMPETQLHGLRGIFSTWALTNLDEATEFITDISNDVSIMGLDFHEAAIQAIAKVVAHKGSDQAIAWAKGLPATSAQFGFRHLAVTIAATNPEAAARIAEAAPESDSGWLANKVAYIWAREDPRAAVAWVDSFARPQDRQEAVRYAVAGWGMIDPEGAAKYLDRAPDVPGEWVATLVREWAYSDPLAAGEWTNSLERNKEAAVGELIRKWIPNDPEAASAWLAEQPAGPAKDSGIEHLIRVIGQTDQEAAMEWLLTISNPDLRTVKLGAMVNYWNGINPATLQEWLNNTEALTQAERESVAGHLTSQD